MKRCIQIFLACLPCCVCFADRWTDYKDQVLGVQSKLPGWCKKEKAVKMMDLIQETHPLLCVEIGVFGGSSLYPTAAALKFQHNGVVYAIDPWLKVESIVGYEAGDPNYEWWGKLDYEQIYSDFLSMISNQKLTRYCKTLRMNAVSAVGHFKDESIDILHIDGNHTEDSALQDATLFFPKVKKGGYIWFDDVNWSSTKKAVIFLMERCELLEERSVGQECFLFRKLDE